MNHFLPRDLRGPWERVESMGTIFPVLFYLALVTAGLDPITPLLEGVDGVLASLRDMLAG